MSKPDIEPLKILVLGGGTAGWIAASLMAKRWAGRWQGRAIEIEVVESPEIPIVGVGEGSTPQLKSLFDYLGLSEHVWMPDCHATYKLGIEFRDWSRRPGFSHYFHPFPCDLDDRTAPGLYFNSRIRRNGGDLPAHPDAFFVSTELAKQKRGPHPAHHFPFQQSYGYHFDAQLIGRRLRQWAVAHGVKHIQATVDEVRLNEAGDIAAVHCRDLGELKADYFIDSTGFRSLLLQSALKEPFLPFASNLFNDAAVVAPTAAETGKRSCQTTSTALSAGWVWRIPLTERVGNGYVYSSRYLDKDAAETEFRAHLDLPEDAPLRHLSMKVGRVERCWARNCLAVGLSQGFIEPLEATALHLVQETVERFIEALEADGLGRAQQDAFNQRIARRFEGIRDYIVCHYRVNGRDDTEYWRDNAGNEVLSDSLRQLLEVWFAGGDLAQELQRQQIGDHYSLASWHCLLAGYGVFPDPAQLKPYDRRHGYIDIAQLEDFIQRCALNYPDHGDLLGALSAARAEGKT